MTWPREGVCGACGRPAAQFPSGRWEHRGKPCRARTQSVWRIDDFAVKLAVRFVAAGEPLPTMAGEWHSHVVEADPATGIPLALGFCNVDHLCAVRRQLAEEAEASHD